MMAMYSACRKVTEGPPSRRYPATLVETTISSTAAARYSLRRRFMGALDYLSGGRERDAILAQTHFWCSAPRSRRRPRGVLSAESLHEGRRHRVRAGRRAE